MSKMPFSWKVKSKWYTVKQTCQQFHNWIKGESLTPKGHDAYDYYCKIIFNGYQPVSYAECMFEEDIKQIMSACENLDRKSAAILRAGQLAKHIVPWEFIKKEHKVIGG